MADNTTELEVLDEIVDVLGGQSGQYETVVPTLQQIRDLLGGGGGGGGYNPALSVGRADALTGADETAQWATRESTGSGAATVRSVQGAAISYNQYVKLPYYSSNTTNSGTEATIAADGTVTIQGTTVDTGDNYSFVRPLSLIGGHKYLVTGIRRFTASGGTPVVRLYDETSGVSIAQATSAAPFFATPANSTEAARLYYNAPNAGITIDLVIQPQLFDLTQMFGSGNEPATVEAFEAMYPEPYYPYSAPTLKPVQIAGIRSTTAQGGELDAIEWETQTLRAAGSVRDELTAGELVARVGVVQVTGNVNYLQASYDGTSTNVQAPLGLSPISGLEFNSDQFVKPTGDGAWRTLKVGEARVAQSGFWLGLPAGITTNAQANAWLAEHKPIFWYPLATPTTTPISPTLSMTYRVQDGGSERIIVPDGEVSAAPVLTIAEGESAAELVMGALACIAAPDGPVATANHAINTYLTMQGKLYKVTSAIAVGESITPNTNVTETTVMAELVARTA